MNEVKRQSNIENRATKQTEMPSHDGQDLRQIDEMRSKHSAMKTNATGNVDNESKKESSNPFSEALCGSIVSQLVEDLHFGQQVPVFVDETSVEEEEKIEIVEVDVDDPLSLSDNDVKNPVKSVSSTKTVLRNPVVEVVTISSDSEEEDEKPLVNLVRKRSSKFGKEKKPTKSLQEKSNKDRTPANPVEKFWQLGPDPKKVSSSRFKINYQLLHAKIITSQYHGHGCISFSFQLW